jgi:hypothetical protein
MPPAIPTIQVDEGGVWRVDGAGRRFGIEWHEVWRVSAYKLDVIDDVDTILELDFDNGHFLELNSSFTGFQDALQRICSYWPDVRPGWASAIEGLRTDDDPITLWQRRP